MRIENNRFLVIGGAGFIGSHVVDLLLQGGAAHVRVFDNFSRGTRENLSPALCNDRVEIFADGGDILHRDVLAEAMKGIDGVFHLAALWLLQCNRYPRSAFDVNVVGLLNVVEEAMARNIQKLVFSSSASVYGDAITEPMPEEHPLGCKEFYGATKACGEMILRSLYCMDRARKADLRFVGLRYMNVYGPRQCDRGAYVGVIARMLRALDVGEQIVVDGDGTQAYDFVDVTDCARANILAMMSDANDQFYNVGTGVKTSINQLVGLICRLHHASAPPRHQAADRPFVRNRIACVERAKKELGFRASVDLEDGLRKFIQWRSQQSLGGSV